MLDTFMLPATCGEAEAIKNQTMKYGKTVKAPRARGRGRRGAVGGDRGDLGEVADVEDERLEEVLFCKRDTC